MGDGGNSVPRFVCSISQASPRSVGVLKSGSPFELMGTIHQNPRKASKATPVSSIVDGEPASPPHPPSLFCAWHNQPADSYNICSSGDGGIAGAARRTLDVPYVRFCSTGER